MANGPISEHGLGQMKPTPGRTPAPRRTVLPAPKPRRRVSLNPMQQATLNVNRLLAPQYAEANQEAQRQNQAIQAYTAAVMQQLAGMAPAIQNDYNNAIGAQQGLVNAAATSLRNVNPSGDVAKLLSAVGAPQAQTDQIQGNLNNVFDGGAAVTQYNQGVSPLGALRAQGEAATTLARLQPSFQALAGRQALQSALANQSDLRAKIAAQTPGLIQDQLNTFTKNSQARQQLALEAQAAGLKQSNTQFNQKVTLAKLQQSQDKYLRDYNLRVKEFNSKQDATAAKAAMPNTSLSKARGYLVDSSGKALLDPNGKKQVLPGFKINAQGQVVKTYKSAASAQAASTGFPNLTKSQVQHLRAGISMAFYGRKEQKDPNTGKIKVTGLPAVNYQQAIQEAISAGYSRAAAVRMANRFYMPGRRGRPDNRAAKRVKAANAAASKGKDATGLGIIVP